MYKRDQIMFDQQAESDDEVDDGGEEIMAIPSRRRRDEGEDVEEEEEGYEAPTKKARKEKVKEDVSGKGRFGKPVVDSDDSAEESGSGSGGSSESESEEEGWGRQYYAMPSSRRAKQDLNDDEYDEQREQDRELEEREVRRLQRKAREALSAEDFGLEDEVVVQAAAPEEEVEEVVPVPETSDPSVLLRHMETHDPVKLALAREWPLVVQKLEKTQRGMRKVEQEQEGQLHKGLGWLHYRMSTILRGIRDGY
jgi:U3 small nucleolar RNA-associated protein 3